MGFRLAEQAATLNFAEANDVTLRGLLRFFWLESLVTHVWHFFTKPRFVWGVRWSGMLRQNSRYGSQSVVLFRENIMLGDNVYIGQFCYIEAQSAIEIGEGCQICYWVSILNHSSHTAIRLYGKEYVHLKSTPQSYNVAPVKIGAYTFVGPHAIIMPGTTIGKGSVVAAYSVVRGEHPDFAILSGNPAIKIGDTRDIDAEELKKHPELQVHYDEWVQRL